MEGYLPISSDAGATSQPAFLNIDETTGQLRLPQGDFLRADFTRSGPDLLIETPAGNAYVVPDYFMTEIPPALITHNGIMLSAKVVTSLAGPLAPDMVAQAVEPGQAAQQNNGLGEPIGQISEGEGQVSVTHANGAKSPLATGDSIFQGDILETATGANVSVIFADDTIFSLDEDARMVMDEMVYDPDTQSGVFNAQVVQGVFSFVSGQVAKTSPEGMVVQTPTSTIGIRGSTGAGKAGAEGSENTITLVPDVDGNVGEFIITTSAGTLTLNSAGATTTTFSANAAPSAAIILSPAQIQQSFGASLTKLVQVVAQKAEADAGRAQDEAQKTDEEAQQAEAEAQQAEAEAQQADETAQQADAEAEAAQAEAEAAAAEADAAKAEAEAKGDPEAIAKAAAAEEKAAESAAKAQAAEAKAQAEATKAEVVKAAAVEKAAVAAEKTAVAEKAQVQAEKASEFSVMTKSVAAAQVKAFDEVKQANPNQQATAEKAANASTVQQQAQAKALADTAAKATQEAAAKAAAEAATKAAAEAAAKAAAEAAAKAAAEAAAKAAAEAEAAAKAAAEAAAKVAAEAAAKAAAEAAAAATKAAAAAKAAATPPNLAPGSTTLAVAGSEDTAITGAVRVTDANNDALTYSLGGGASHGSVTVGGDGTFTYTPTANFAGTDAFTITASDGKGGTSTSTVSVNVTGVNDTPVVSAATAFTVNEDTNLTLSKAQLLAQATDPDGDTMSVVNVAATNGTLTDNGNDTWTFKGTAGFNGTSDLTYSVEDPDGLSVAATGVITVSSVNTAPIITPSSPVTTYVATTAISTTNTLTTGNQGQVSSAKLSDGSYVVVWSSADTAGPGADASGTHISAQLFNAAGVAQGSEFQVNTSVNSTQDFPNVVGLTGGGFVVSWNTSGNPGDTTQNGIAAQIYSNTGVAQGTEFLVNTSTLGAEQHPDLAALSTGGFVVAYETTLTTVDGSGYAIQFQKFDASGNKVGSETIANTATAGIQNNVAVTHLANGQFVMAWNSNTDVRQHGQIFNADGTKSGSEFNIDTASTTANVELATLSDGGFVAVYTKNTNVWDIAAQRFDVNGTKVGSEISVNTSVAGEQVRAQVTAFDGGGFFVTWFDNQASNQVGRAFDANGAALGGEQTFGAGSSTFTPESTVIALADGTVAVHWVYAPWGGSVMEVSGGIFSGSTYSSNTYTENGAAKAVDATLTLADDSAIITGASVTITGNYNSAQDVLSFTNTNGITGTWNTNTGAMTLTGNATVANYQAALRTVMYQNTSDVPTTGVRTIEFKATDDQSLTGSAGITKMTITSVNDAPTISGTLSDTMVQGETLSFLSSHFSAADADNPADSTLVFTLTTAPTNGELQLNNVKMNANSTFTQADVTAGYVTYVHDASATTTDTFQFTLSDGVASTASQTVTLTLGNTITGTSGADTLTGSAAAITYNGMAGNDTIDGGAGTDVLNLNGAMSNYTWSFNANGVLTLTDGVGTDGTDTISNIETLKFTDGAVTTNDLTVAVPSDYALASSATNLTSHTMEAWIKTSAPSDWGGILSAQADGSNFVQFVLSNTGVPRVQIFGGSVAATANAVASVSNGQWHHVAYSYDAVTGMLQFYIDGVASGTAQSVGTGYNLTATLQVGAERVMGQSINGKLADVRVWNDVRTAQEIAANKDAQLTGSEANLQHYWKFETGNTLLDSDVNSGAGDTTANLTLQGNATIAASTNPLSIANSTITITTEAAEYRVNTTTALGQENARIIPVEDGGYVIVWQHDNGANLDVMGQRYDAAGQPVLTGGVHEFTVASGTSNQGLYLYSQMEALPNGGFVVTWHDNALGVNDWTALATIYNAAGTAVASDIQLNTYTTDEQAHTSMAVIGNGDLLFVWQSLGQDAAGGYGVYAQRLDSNGTKIGGEVQINTTTTNSQYQPMVVSLNDGGYAVFWSDNSAGANTENIMGRFFDSSGNQTVAEFTVNTVTAGAQYYPKAAVLNNGNIVLTWSDNTADGSGNGIYATILNSSGTVVTAQFMVPVDGVGEQGISSVAALEGGGFVIVWHEHNGTDYNVLGQIFNASGTKVGGEIAINTYTTGDQHYASVMPQYDGGFIATWQSNGQDGADFGIYSQRFDASGNVVGRTTLTGNAADNTFNLAAAQKGIDIDGASGTDSVVLTGTSADKNVIKVSNVESITGAASEDIVLMGSTLNNTLTIDLGASKDIIKLADGGNTNSFTNVEEVIGGTGNDVVTILTTFVAADKAWFNGEGGTDVLNLTAGDDYFSAETFETINAGAGTDTLAFDNGGDIQGVTLNGVENIAIDYDNNNSTSLSVSATTVFAAGTTIIGTGGNDGISSKASMDLTNVTLSGISNIWIDSDSATANNVGATLTLNATTLPSGISISGSGDDIIQAAGATLDLSAATLNGILSINAAASGTTITGSAGNNVLLGGAANDILIGKNGVDTMTGGGGADIFTYFTSGEGGDTITDFTAATDKLYFAQSGFTSTTALYSTLNVADFTSGASVTSGNYFTFDTTTNNLYYDADAAGAGASVLIATLNTAITEADIVIA